MNTSPSQSISALRDLLSLVVENTKRSASNKPAKDKQEASATAKALTLLLGRKPTPDEVAAARRF
jgi:hypothetical protein